MLLAIAPTNTAKGLIENTPATLPHIDTVVKKRILNSTVKLVGTGRDGASTFIGSGAIFTAKTGEVTILTAAHNLLVWAGQPSFPVSDTNKAAFVAAVAIRFGSGASQNVDLTFGAAPTGNVAISSLTIPAVDSTCGSRAACLYDLMVIKSTNSALVKFAREQVFNNQSDSVIAEKTQTEALQTIKRSTDMLKKSRYHFIQLGYGNKVDDRNRLALNSDGRTIETVTRVPGGAESGPRGRSWYDANSLQYNIVSPSYAVYKSYFDQTSDTVGQALAYFEYAEAIALASRRVGTTAPGDSGGPLYAIDKQNPKAFLLGVTTGADMQPGKKHMKPFKNVISTSIVPYLKLEYDS